MIIRVTRDLYTVTQNGIALSQPTMDDILFCRPRHPDRARHQVHLSSQVADGDRTAPWSAQIRVPICNGNSSRTSLGPCSQYLLLCLSLLLWRPIHGGHSCFFRISNPFLPYSRCCSVLRRQRLSSRSSERRDKNRVCWQATSRR